MCDRLVVGVTVDELVAYKSKQAVIPFVERIEVVRSCRYVDVAIPQRSIDKLEVVKKIGADLLFVGDDWYQSDSWKKMEEDLAEVDCKVVYFPYTQGTSSTLINKTLEELRGEG
jgi:choline-phosphate cytidylyltransferase/glycerol-3-phosphate cytidylyltransferase